MFTTKINNVDCVASAYEHLSLNVVYYCWSAQNKELKNFNVDSVLALYKNFNDDYTKKNSINTFVSAGDSFIVLEKRNAQNLIFYKILICANGREAEMGWINGQDVFSKEFHFIELTEDVKNILTTASAEENKIKEKIFKSLKNLEETIFSLY